MAHRIAVADGNWTTGGTWQVADGTSLSDAQNNVSTVTTTFVSSATFTPGAITVAAIAVKIGQRAGTTGTFSARLFNASAAAAVAGTTVTVNMTDVLPTTGFTPGLTINGCPAGWMVFLFSAPVTLIAATNYTVQLSTSNANQVSVLTNGTANNWSRMLITTTTGAPAAGDSMFVLPIYTAAATRTTYTVTVDETASTDYGSANTINASLGVGDGCALEYATSGDNLLRLSGHVNLWGTGRLTMGSAATPIPNGASAVLEFDCASNGQFGIVSYPSSTIEINGSPRTAGKLVTWCLLNTDEAAAQTTLGVDTDTGWLSGDDITIGTTTRTTSQTENRILDGDAGASSLAVTVGLTNAHSGTAPTQAEVANFTRNVIIRAVSTSSWFWRDGCDAAATFTWAAFLTCGGASGNNAWRLALRVSGEVTRSRTFQFCAFAEQTYSIEGVNVEGGLMTFEDCCFRASVNLATLGGMFYNSRMNVEVQRCCFLYTGTIQSSGITMVGATRLVVRDSRFVGAQLVAPIAAYSFGNYFSMDLEDCEFHGFPTNVGALNAGSPDRYAAFRVVNCNFWRNNHPPVLLTSAARGDFLFQGCDFTGNITNHVNMPSGAQAEPVARFVDCDFESEAAFTTGTGVFFGTTWTGRAEFQDCRFSQVSAHTNNDIGRTGTVSDMACYGSILFNQCLFGAATPVATAVTGGLGGYGRVSFMNEDGIVDAHRTLTQFGTIENQTSVFNTAAPSEQLTPNASAEIGVRGLRSSPVFKPVPQGQSVTFSVFIRRSAAHNGDMPQMIVWANGQGGWTDTRATFVGGTDVWVELTCTVGPADNDSVAEACIEVDGTAGSVYIDDWSAAVA